MPRPRSERRRAWPVVVLVGLVILPVLYVLSIGPAARLIHEGGPDQRCDLWRMALLRAKGLQADAARIGRIACCFPPDRRRERTLGMEAAGQRGLAWILPHRHWIRHPRAFLDG